MFDTIRMSLAETVTRCYLRSGPFFHRMATRVIGTLFVGYIREAVARIVGRLFVAPDSLDKWAQSDPRMRSLLIQVATPEMSMLIRRSIQQSRLGPELAGLVKPQARQALREAFRRNSADQSWRQFKEGRQS